MFFKKTNAMLGIAFSNQALHILSLNKQNPTVVTSAISIPVPDNVFIDGKIENWSFIQLALQRLIAEHNWRGMPTAIVIPQSLTRLQSMRLVSNLSDSEMHLAIQQRLNQEMPALVDEISFDYQVEMTGNDLLATVHVLMTRKIYLQQLANLIKDLGLALSIIDVDFFIIARLVAWQQQFIIANRYYFILFKQRDSFLLLICYQSSFMHYAYWSDDLTPQILDEKLENVLHHYQLPASQTIIFLPPQFTTDVVAEWKTYNPLESFKLEAATAIKVAEFLTEFTCALGAAYSLINNPN